jgi:MFS family permease
MILAFLLAALTQAKLIAPLGIMCIAVLNGVVMAFDAPSRQAVVVELVGRKHLLNAIALNSVAFNSSRIIGPALAGILVSVIGMSGCFFINGVSFLAVIIALFAIRLGKDYPGQGNKSAFRDLKAGLAFVRDNRLILVLMSMVGISSLFGISYMILMPVFANDVLHAGVKGLGLLMSGSGIGALIAALLLARLGDYRNKGKPLVISSLIFSLALVLFSLSKTFFLSFVILVFIGAASVTAIALINTVLQTIVRDEFRGRVMSVFMLTFAGMKPFGNLIAGSLSQGLGASAAVFISGITCTLFFIAINIFYPKIKEI